MPWATLEAVFPASFYFRGERKKIPFVKNVVLEDFSLFWYELS